MSYVKVTDGDKPKASDVKILAMEGGRDPVRPRKWPVGVEPSAGKQVGSVKWFDVDKGFGFVSPKSGDPDIFVHKSGITAVAGRKSLKNLSLMEGEEVEFAVILEDGKPKAIDVAGPNGEGCQGAPGNSFRRRKRSGRSNRRDEDEGDDMEDMSA